MIRGHNSDINVRGRSYHIQTEDWGDANPFIVSRVFSNGAVLKTLKVPYAEALRNLSIQTSEALKTALQRQHAEVIDSLIEGRLP